MKRSPLVHERVFAGDFAEDYARKHGKIAEKFGREVAQKLVQRSRLRAGVFSSDLLWWCYEA